MKASTRLEVIVVREPTPLELVIAVILLKLFI